MDKLCIDQIRNAFVSSRARYLDLESRDINSDRVYKSDLRADFFQNPPSSLQALLLSINYWDKHGIWKREIVRNLESLNYRETCVSELSMQFNFIKLFNEALHIFFNDRQKFQELIAFLHSWVQLETVEVAAIDKGQFFLAVQLYYISVYDLVEGMLKKYDPDFNVLLIKDQYLTDPNQSFIMLNYGEKNGQTIELLYNGLYGKFIRCELEEFKGLFKKGSTSKIQWHNSEPNLVNLFLGMDKLKILNTDGDLLKVLATRLINKKRSQFDAEQLRVSYAKSSAAPRDSQELDALVKKINRVTFM